VTIPFVLLIFPQESHVAQQLTHAQLLLNRRQFIAAAAPYGAAKPQRDYIASRRAHAIPPKIN
jgi:hypothetical protein